MLEDYNDWNLPFAKSVEIMGRYTGQLDYNGTYPHVLGANTYKMEVDPSALFSILFLEQDVFPDHTESDLKSLNYTFLGDQSII